MTVTTLKVGSDDDTLPLHLPTASTKVTRTHLEVVGTINIASDFVVRQSNNEVERSPGRVTLHPPVPEAVTILRLRKLIEPRLERIIIARNDPICDV